MKLLIEELDGLKRDLQFAAQKKYDDAEQDLCAEQMEQTDRQNRLLRGIALIHMDSALHHRDGYAVTDAENKSALMSLDR